MRARTERLYEFIEAKYAYGGLMLESIFTITPSFLKKKTLNSKLVKINPIR